MAFYVLILVAGVVCWLFLDQIIQFFTENLLGALTFGAVGGGALAANKKKRKEAAIIRDEHEQLEQAKVDESIRELIKADEQHEQAQDIAEGITKPNEKTKSGYTRKRFTSS